VGKWDCGWKETAKGKLNYGRETGGKEIKMVSIAEEKRRMIGSNILFGICLVGLIHDSFIRSDNSVTAVTIGFAITASIGAAAAMYSKLRIEMLTLLEKRQRET
jgi:hypothetical protein